MSNSTSKIAEVVGRALEDCSITPDEEEEIVEAVKEYGADGNNVSRDAFEEIRAAAEIHAIISARRCAPGMFRLLRCLENEYQEKRYMEERVADISSILGKHGFNVPYILENLDLSRPFEVLITRYDTAFDGNKDGAEIHKTKVGPISSDYINREMVKEALATSVLDRWNDKIIRSASCKSTRATRIFVEIRQGNGYSKFVFLKGSGSDELFPSSETIRIIHEWVMGQVGKSFTI